MRIWLAGVAALLAAGPALAQPAPAPTPSPADKAMMAGMATMNHAMADAPMTGNPDHDFVVMMLPHHQGAVDMAQVELKDGHDPALKKLAREIVASQTKEIAFMKRWLAAHPQK